MLAEISRRIPILVIPILAVLLSAGCSERKESISLATLPDGGSLRLRELRRDLLVEKREVVCRSRSGAEQALVVSSADSWADEGSIQGFEVLRDGPEITVWKLAGDREEALAAVATDENGRVTGELHRPRKARRVGQRLGCDIHRQLARADVGHGEYVCLSVSSVRDAGAIDPKANQDTYWLDWTCPTGGRRSGEGKGVGTTVAALGGLKCLSDPFNSRPNFEVRWDQQRKAAWVVDRAAHQVLGGFQVEPFFFDQGNVPACITATAGQVIATVADR